MRVSFAILVLALAHFVSAPVHASDDFLNVVSAEGKHCYSRYGLEQPKNYCNGTADFPKVEGSGPFASCVVETTMQLLEGKTNAVQFLASGKVQPKLQPPAVVHTKDGPTDTYTITIGNKSVEKSETVVKVVTTNGKIVTASSAQFSQDPLTHKINVNKDPDYKTILNYGYVKDADGKDKCEINTIDFVQQYQPKIRTYSRWICNAVGDFVKQSHNLSDAERDKHVLQMLTNYAGKTTEKDANASFMYGMSPATRPAQLGDSSIPQMLSACKLSGATGSGSATNGSAAGSKLKSGSVPSAESAD